MKKNIFFKALFILFIWFSCSKNDIVIKAEKVDGKYHGKYQELNPNGNKLKEGYMVNGLKHGLWKNYENNDLISVQRFKNDSLEYELDKNDYIYREVYLEQIQSYVPIPKNWDTNVNFENEKLLLTSVKDCDNPEGYCPNIVFTYENLDDISFKDFVFNDRKQLSENLEDFKEVKFGKNNGRYDSYELRYVKRVKGVNTAGLCIWFNFDDKVVIFTSRSEKKEINKYILLFMEVGNSITKK